MIRQPIWVGSRGCDRRTWRRFGWGSIWVRRLSRWFGAGLLLLALAKGLGGVGCLTLVSGPSMEPGFRSGDFLWIDRRAYRDRAPARGDVVVATYRGEWIVKRVVAMPGERVEVRNGEVWIEGKPGDEGQPVSVGPLTIEEGRLFADRYALLGDNRSEPSSVMVHAVVSSRELVGQVVYRFRIWPFAFDRVS